MQYHTNGFRPGDPEVFDAAPGRPQDATMPEQVDVLIVGCGPAGLTLASGQCAQGIQTPGDCGDEPSLAFDIGCHRPKQRWMRLIGAVGPPQTLDGGIGTPPGFQQEMHTPLLVLCA